MRSLAQSVRKGNIMRNEFCKCYFCRSYDEYEGCEYGCNSHEGYTPDTDRLIRKSKEKDISVSDVIALINATN